MTPQVPRRVVVDGELHDESGDRPRTHRFHDRFLLARRAGTVPLLILRIDTDDGVIHLDARGALQEDGVLTVTLALRLRHGPRPAEHDLDGPGDVGAEANVVPAAVRGLRGALLRRGRLPRRGQRVGR